MSKRPRDLEEPGSEAPPTLGGGGEQQPQQPAGLAEAFTDFDVREDDVVDPEDDLEVEERKYFAVDEDEEEGSSEDLFGDGFENDYRGNEALDRYDAGDIDDRTFSELSIADQMAVTNMLDRRDRIRARDEGRIPAAFLGDDEDDQMMRMPRRRRHRAGETDLMDEDELDPNALDPNFVLDDFKGRTIAEWLTMDQPRRHVAHRFRKFLTEFVDSHGNSIYEDKIQRMCEANGRSLEVSYRELHGEQPLLAIWVADAPAEMLVIFNSVATEMVKERFNRYDRISGEISVRIYDLPSQETIRDLRHLHVNRLVRIYGVVTRRSAVLPQIKYVTFVCSKCSHTAGPFYQDSADPIKINQCSACGSRGPFAVKSELSSYRDFQKITLQESPGSVPPGRLPRHKEVILLGDLVDSVRPGEEIEVSGVYRNVLDITLNATNGFPLFATVIEANHIGKHEDKFASNKLSQEDRAAILELSRDPRIGRRIIKSIGPSIYGHEAIKTALALSLFGGVPKDVQGKQRLRGDINVLMLGDPGTAKSQFLKYVEKTVNRAVFTTGQGASGVGLTACVQKSPITREWTLEGGALVLADKGFCLIDEFDKMNDQDRTSIHEAMEQQSISVSKAGIVCTLQARCAVLAAANPMGGRYNSLKSFQDNVLLTEPILSRFDVLCVVKDLVDVEADQRLAQFVVSSHMRSHPDSKGTAEQVSDLEEDILSQDLLRKYLMYARENVKPRLNMMDEDKLAQVYSSLRKESLACGSIPMTVRHVESMIRMAEAHAKMHLRDYVRQDDLDVAIRVMLESFLAANKHHVAKTLAKKFQKYMSTFRDNEELLHHVLKTLANEQYKYQLYNNPQFRRRQEETATELQFTNEITFEAEEFEFRARELGIHDVSPFYKGEMFRNHGYCLETRLDGNGREGRFISKSIGATD